MRPITSPRKLTRSAAIALAVWLMAVIAVVLWRRPEFWVEPDERFRRAEALAREQNWSGSVAAIEPALSADPDNVGYLVFKAYRQLDLGDTAGAHQTFSRAIALDRSHADARLGSASALVRLRRQDEAATMLQTLSAETISASHLHRRSQLYSAIGAREAALGDMSLLLHDDPGNAVFLKDAAELALMLEDWERAASFLERLHWASADPQVKRWAAENRTAALEAAGYRAAREGRHPDAADLFQILAEQNPGNVKVRRDRAHALRSAGRLRDAETAFRELLADHAADVDTRIAYAWLLNTQHRYAEAWQVVEPLPRPAADVTLLELQARTSIWAGRTAESIHLIRALIERRRNDAELWKRLSEAWQKMKDDRQAAHALGVYLRLQSQDWRARERLAQILTKLGSLDAAIAEYRQLLAGDPDSPEFLRSLGLIHETAGDLEAAATYYLRSIDASAAAPPELLLRVARVHRWMKRPEAAIPWYERYLERAAPDAPLRHTAHAELALSLLDSGNPAAAAARLRTLEAPLDAGELVLGARAATANAQPAEAVAYLELLGDLRTLTADEELWLAGQYRAAGNRAHALFLYERVAANTAATPETLEAIGDLRYDAGDYVAALSAFQQLTGDDIALKIARSAVRAGQLSLASDTYERYVRAHPDDRRARLEAARYNASAGRPHIAIAHYREYIGAQGAAGLRLEVARAHLAAEQFDAAEQWARQAVAAGENPDLSRLALTQSLHLLGRHHEARAVLVELLRDAPARSDAHEWRGHIAVALDRHLEAFRSFDRALAAGGSETGRLLLLKGTAALKRGDYARAALGYRMATSTGADPAAVDAARRELRSLTLPTVNIPLWGLRDSNQLSVVQAGGGLLALFPFLSGELAIDGARGAVSQRSYSSAVNSVRLTLSRLFPRPELNLGFALGLSQFDRAPDLLTWQAGGLYHLGERATLGFDVSREAVLPLDEKKQLRQFNRVLDVAGLGPGFRSDVFRGTVELAANSIQQTRVETGLEKFQDGNRRAFAYLHFQLPTASSARVWTAIRPNVFFETFRDRRRFYYSPSRHVTVGTMLHTIRRHGGWDIESEINPQLLFTDGETGAGGHGLLSVGTRVGPTSVSGGAFIFWDGLENHVQWRVGGRVSVPLGR